MAEDLEEDFDESEVSDEMDMAPAGGGKPSRGKNKLILILIPLLLIVGGAAGAYFTGFADPLLKMFHKDKAATAPEETTKAGPAEAVAHFYDLPEILVNLNSAGRKQNFLKIKVSLELESPLDDPKVDQVMPRIIDTFQVYLRELRIEDLQGSAGLLRLREELLVRVNAAAKPVKVNDVLFKEMLVQ
jgi:flagellar FliL protein